MGNKPNMKPGKNEIIRRTNILMGEIYQLKKYIDYTHRLITEFVSFSGKEEEFNKHLEEIMNANKEEGRELREGSGTDKDTRNNKQTASRRQEKTVKSSNSTKKSTSVKGTGESGNIGL